MKQTKVIAGLLVVLGFGGSCAYRGMKNYAPEETPATSNLPGNLMPGVEIMRPKPVAYGPPPVILVPPSQTVVVPAGQPAVQPAGQPVAQPETVPAAIDDDQPDDRPDDTRDDDRDEPQKSNQ